MASSSWGKWSDSKPKKWRDDLRDIDFWLKGYRETRKYRDVSTDAVQLFSSVSWNVGVMPMASFTRVITRLAVDNALRNFGPFEQVIKVDLKPASTADEAMGSGILSIQYQLAIAVAKELGLLDQKYNRLKEEYETLQYYSYGWFYGGRTSEWTAGKYHVRDQIVPQILKQLLTEKYLLVVENLQWPIDRDSFIGN